MAAPRPTRPARWGRWRWTPALRSLRSRALPNNTCRARYAAKALMIKYEQRRGMMAQDWNRFERRMAPLLNTLGLHFATDGYTPVRRGPARDFLCWGYFQSERYFCRRQRSRPP